MIEHHPQTVLLHPRQLLAPPNSDTALYLFGPETPWDGGSDMPFEAYRGLSGAVRYLARLSEGSYSAMARVMHDAGEIRVSEFYVDKSAGENAATMRALSRQLMLDYPQLRRRTGRRELPSVASIMAARKNRHTANSRSLFGLFTSRNPQ